ncbi:pre-rRNA-processing protein TSR1 homolog [Schistocerca nitens]|uniref:pre-rRNA-processing protein TSR1 homolog n=1 Tax=Schistocerca nitens TaxID=7011 RepID=UPI002117E5A3|nr:pre-rRNA-processing protein TSR1 homolog [Schistocerca nitens]
MNSVQERHRPGVLKQQNKSHKHGRHRSKGAIHDALKGRVSAKATTKKVSRELHREERRNQAMQLRQKKREEMLLKKRFSSGVGNNHPLLLSVVPLSEKIDPLGVLELLKQADSDAVINNSSTGNVHISIPRLKQRFTIVCPRHGDLYGVLDALKVSDTVLFLLSADEAEGLDTTGEVLLTAAMAQGLPTPVVAVTHLDNVPIKKQHDKKNQLQKIFSRWLPDMKIMALDKCDEALNVLRRAGSQKLRSVTYRDRRPHMLVEEIEFVADSQEGDHGILKVSGYLRGHDLSVNGLLHIPNWGDFQMEKIEAPSDPYPISVTHKKHSEAETRLLEEADPSKQESLLSENPIDPMDAEQTWPTAEEIAEAEKEQKAQRLVKRVPKGMSDYQAAWIPDCDAEVDSDDESDISENPAVDAQSEMSSENDYEENEDEYETVSVSEAGEDAEKYDEKMDMEEENETLKKLKEAREDKIFPDERDTPQDIPARTRFQKYRGLQSFRTSPWDPKENLPQDYARIFQFENFERMRKRLLKEDDMEGALVGWYITVHVKNVPRHFVESHKSSDPLTIFGLLPHEQKMSLLNVVLKRPNTLGGQLPIKSKEQLIIHCGYRRFKACPIFSQHTNGSKHKYERFFQPDTTVVASMYAPIIFPPCPVLAFKETKQGTQMLVGIGSVLSINPDRIVVKRIVLSGHPIKVNKRSAVVRYMFFNREDINWFKPVELHTKYGRRGHIKEPLGTHGHMKCVFDGQLKSQDTVLMNLYKRVFPKWTYDPCVRVPHSMYNYSDLMSVDEVD